MKKLIAMLVVGGFLAASVIGCGPATTSENKPTAGPGPGGTPAAGAEKTANGKVTKAEKDSVTVGDTAYKVTADTKITLDGKDAKAEDLKDTTATVTYKDSTATKIEAKK